MPDKVSFLNYFWHCQRRHLELFFKSFSFFERVFYILIQWLFKFDILTPVDCLKFHFRCDLRYSRSKAVQSWVGVLYMCNLFGLQVVLPSFRVVLFDILKKNQEGDPIYRLKIFILNSNNPYNTVHDLFSISFQTKWVFLWLEEQCVNPPMLHDWMFIQLHVIIQRIKNHPNEVWDLQSE